MAEDKPAGQADIRSLTISVILKLLIVILTFSVLCMISADYAEWYTIVVIFLVASCTLMYAIISPVLHYLTMTRSPRDLRHWATTETVSSALFVCAWLVNCLICADMAHSIDNDTAWLLICATSVSSMVIILWMIVGLLFARQSIPACFEKRSFNRALADKTSRLSSREDILSLQGGNKSHSVIYKDASQSPWQTFSPILSNNQQTAV